MNRKEFLKLSSSIIGGLAIPGVFEDSIYAAVPGELYSARLDKSYLIKCITG
ncbi:MAG: hypothetical protein O3C43_12740 [Verrucomicrobia bacterium]|nr:hypothetical protein [Verrucomicrobiota bacterium]MDA1067360.1 hypothetical protein [Verrucomicrobiota bacterium]